MHQSLFTKCSRVVTNYTNSASYRSLTAICDALNIKYKSEVMQ